MHVKAFPRLLWTGEGWDGMEKPAVAPGDLTPLPVGSTYATITVYRDAKRVFISAYDAKTSFLRFVAIANDSTALNELLAPNSVEVRYNIRFE